MPELAVHLGMPLPIDPEDIDTYLPYLERMRAEGSYVWLKIDGPRPGKNQYTPVASGGRRSIRTRRAWSRRRPTSSSTTRARAGASRMINDERDTATLLYALQGLALARALPIPERLVGLRMFEPLLDEVRQNKGLLLLNFTPPPGKPTYTVSISGGLLWDGGPCAAAASDDVMERSLAAAILEYARRCWAFRW